MKITAITAHCDRPEAWKLCEQYLGRQTRQPDQWLVIDSSENPTTPSIPCDYYHRPDLDKMGAKVLWAIENDLIKGDGVVWLENDDYYFPTWIEWCERRLAIGYEIVGQGNALYYNVRRRWWSECKNVRHASLCQTAIGRDLLEPLVNIIKSFDNQFFDTRLWRLERNKYLHLPKEGERLVIGMKALPGKVGYSGEHSQINPAGVQADPSLFHLWKLLGEDALLYAPFKK